MFNNRYHCTSNVFFIFIKSPFMRRIIVRFKLIWLNFSKRACYSCISSDHFERFKIKSKYDPNDLLNYLMDFLINIFITSGFKSLKNKHRRSIRVMHNVHLSRLQVMRNFFNKTFDWNLIHHIMRLPMSIVFFFFNDRSMFTQRATNEFSDTINFGNEPIFKL